MIEAEIDRQVGILERYCSCEGLSRVMVQACRSDPGGEERFHVRLEVTVIDLTMVVDTRLRHDIAGMTAGSAIRSAFSLARRRLPRLVSRVEADRGHMMATGRIACLSPDGSFGFLLTETGEEVFVRPTAWCYGGLSGLKVGDTVQYRDMRKRVKAEGGTGQG